MTVAAFRIAVVVFALAFFARLPGLGSILTVDEPQWIFRAQSFFQALERGDPSGTFQGTHPGVVPMLLIGGGIRLRELLTSDHLESPQVGAFRVSAKLPIAMAVSLGIGAAAAAAAACWGTRTGLASGALLALDPTFLGHSQLAHVDALLAILMLLSLLVLLVYLQRRQSRLLLLAGVLGGLALLTKLPALFLFPFTLLVLLLGRGRAQHLTDQGGEVAGDVLSDVIPAPAGADPVSNGRPAGWAERKASPPVLASFVVWSAAALFTFLLLWPSMWLNFTPNFRYAARDVRTVTTTPHQGEELQGSTVGRLSSSRIASGLSFYARGFVARAHPVLLALGIAGFLLAWRRRSPLSRREAVFFLSAAVGFLVLLTLVAKRADRYVLPSLLLWDVLAGTALTALFQGKRWGTSIVTLALGGLGMQALLLRPNALAFESPLAWREEPTQSGWGEGLERAAAFLNAHPLARDLVVASWYPAVFGEFFEGQTMSLSSRDDRRVSHVVLYRNMRGRGPASAATTILEEYAGRESVATVSVLGREIAWVYETDSVAIFPEHVGEIVGHGGGQAPTSSRLRRDFAGQGTPSTAVEVGQFIHPDRNGLQGVRLGFATFSSRKNTTDIVFHLREDPDGPNLRTVRLNAATIEDRAWREISFDPLTDSAGKTYYLAVTSPNGRRGDAVTVQFQPKDLLPGRMVLLRAPLPTGARRADRARDGDLAYRLVY